jgi:hypothetical protein
VGDTAFVLELFHDRQALGGVMSILGFLYQLLGQHDKAILQLEQASAIANEVGDWGGQGAFVCQPRGQLPSDGTV